VTERLEVGRHALAAEVADGWYAGYVGYGYRREHYGKHLRVRAQIVVDYADGSREVLGTGADWRAAEGPLREADFLMGERRDERLEAVGWSSPDFDDSGWHAVHLGAEDTPLLQAHPAPPVRAIAEFEPVSQRELESGRWIFDLGQNIAGVVRLRVRGEAGDEIRLRHAERLDDEGGLYTTNLRGARAEDVYTCRGGGEEVFEPRFTFHGFQYVEVAGLRDEPRPGDVVGLALSSDTPVVGSFECSDERITRLVRNAYWTQRANFIDIPTDCPQRDERLGWTGDAQVYLRSAALLCDVQTFFRKWLTDLEDAQREDGQFPMVAPLKVAGSDGGPAWADAGVFCPWDVWEAYGNLRDLERRYESMKRFVEFCRARSTEELLPPEEFHCFGDWLHVDDETPHEVIYSAYFAASTDRLARAAQRIGRVQDAAHYADLAKRARQAFRAAYVSEAGLLRGDSQTGYVLALAFDLVEGEQREAFARRLVEKIEERDGHLSTGFVGTKDLMGVLARIGRNDVAYRLLEQDTHPSWLFGLKHGATSIWERWNGWTPEEGFADPGMNSFAHYAFGAVVQWIFENVGGIQVLQPGYAAVTLRPQPGGNLEWARTTHRSLRGPIESSWRLEPGRLSVDVSLPPGDSGRLHLPTRDPSGVREGGQAVDVASGVVLASVESEELVLDLASGDYAFEVDAPVLQISSR
jgi:alpha-L-rhamnosidase